MHIEKLSTEEFQYYTYNHNLTSYNQTLQYAKYKELEGYTYDLIGLKDQYNNIIAASLILFKKVDNKYVYGYAPRGFLIDYNNLELLQTFNQLLFDYYKKYKVVFIKINPYIYISKYDKKNNRYIYNENSQLIMNLKQAKYQELKRNKNFESKLPAFTPIIDLKSFNYYNLDKNVRNKIRKSYRRGLSIEKIDYYKLDTIYPLFKNKTKKSLAHYQNLYKALFLSNMIDVFQINVNFEEFLINTKEQYQKTYEKNQAIVDKIAYTHDSKILNQKLQSDNELRALEDDIVMATKGITKSKIKTIAGAIVIKYKDKVTVYVSGYNYRYKKLNPKDYLYYKLIEYYKYNYNYLDLNGFSGDTNNINNQYKGLNNFILGFNPTIVETIGEYDLILDQKNYPKLIKAIINK